MGIDFERIGRHGGAHLQQIKKLKAEAKKL